MKQPSDKQPDLKYLIVEAKQGNEQAFELLYEHYFSPLHRYILIRVGDDEEADDLTQQVFVKFYRNLSNWQDKGYQPSAYLYSIARSVIADYYRKKARQGTKISNSEDILSIISDSSQNPHTDVIQTEEIKQLYINLKQLPDNYQEVLLLRYMEDLASLEIAKIIDKSDVATRKLLSRAVSALAKIANNDRDI